MSEGLLLLCCQARASSQLRTAEAQPGQAEALILCKVGANQIYFTLSFSRWTFSYTLFWVFFFFNFLSDAVSGLGTMAKITLSDFQCWELLLDTGLKTCAAM